MCPSSRATQAPVGSPYADDGGSGRLDPEPCAAAAGRRVQQLGGPQNDSSMTPERPPPPAAWHEPAPFHPPPGFTLPLPPQKLTRSSSPAAWGEGGCRRLRSCCCSPLARLPLQVGGSGTGRVVVRCGEQAGQAGPRVTGWRAASPTSRVLVRLTSPRPQRAGGWVVRPSSGATQAPVGSPHADDGGSGRLDLEPHTAATGRRVQQLAKAKVARKGPPPAGRPTRQPVRPPPPVPQPAPPPPSPAPAKAPTGQPPSGFRLVPVRNDAWPPPPKRWVRAPRRPKRAPAADGPAPTRDLSELLLLMWSTPVGFAAKRLLRGVSCRGSLPGGAVGACRPKP